MPIRPYKPPPLTRAEAEHLHVEQGNHVLKLVDAVEFEEPQAPELPCADELSRVQFEEAVARLHEDTRAYPRFPWPQLAAVAGPLCPGNLVIVAARTGNGKSLFLQNLFDRLICDGQGCVYIGLEQPASELRDKWACLRADIRPALVMAPQPEEYGTLEWQRAMDLVQVELKWQRTQEIRELAHFAGTRKINAHGLRKWTEWGVDLGCGVVIVDHVDRIEHGPGKNSFHEVSETIRMAKELAIKHRIVMLLASQVSRPGDQMEQFIPPSLHNLRGAGTKEEEADTVLGVYRPLRANITEPELKRARQGLAEKSLVYQPGVMAVTVLKHRLDGPVAGKIVKLAVKHQRVTDLPEKDMHSAREFL